MRKNWVADEAQWLYSTNLQSHLVSLPSLQRICVDWMKNDIMNNLKQKNQLVYGVFYPRIVWSSLHSFSFPLSFLLVKLLSVEPWWASMSNLVAGCWMTMTIFTCKSLESIKSHNCKHWSLLMEWHSTLTPKIVFLYLKWVPDCLCFLQNRDIIVHCAKEFARPRMAWWYIIEVTQVKNHTNVCSVLEASVKQAT